MPQTLTQPWNPTEACYADCNGNGTINADDVQGIVSNWFLTHSKSDNPIVDKISVCYQLLSEIDRQQPLTNGIREVRNAVVNLLKNELGEVFIYALDQNYPNPFNTSTTIRFFIPEEVATVRLVIFNVLGQQVWDKTLIDVLPGPHVVEWFGETITGSLTPSGVYAYRISAGSFTSVKRMLLIK
jgi:hypothetical protein